LRTAGLDGIALLLVVDILSDERLVVSGDSSSKEGLRLMNQYLRRWYGRLATRTVRYPRSPKWIPFLPKAILTPDYPVPKHSKKTLMQVTINDGLHYQGPVLATRNGTRLQEPLDVHFRQHGPTYFTKELHHIDVKPVTHDPEFVVDYCMKARKNRCSPDEIIIFPRTVSELPTNGPIGPLGRSQCMTFGEIIGNWLG
jgi:hypothetical protein